MVIFEAFGVIFKTFFLTTENTVKAIWSFLPEIIKLKQVVGYFSPAGIVGLCISAPTILIKLLFFVIKKLAKSKYNLPFKWTNKRAWNKAKSGKTSKERRAIYYREKTKKLYL